MSEKYVLTYLGDEVPVKVYYDYQPYEPMGRNYPGCAAGATITAVCVDGKDDKDILGVLSKGALEHLEEQCLDHTGDC